jgi:hypothetical protein
MTVVVGEGGGEGTAFNVAYTATAITTRVAIPKTIASTCVISAPMQKMKVGKLHLSL